MRRLGPFTPTVVVFVGSTWTDLRHERAAVEFVVRNFRETRFAGMEYFGSRTKSALSESLSEVGRADLYLGIFGQRYGSGITEAEYRHARRLGIPCLLYILSPSAKPPVAPDPRQQDLLEELRQNVDSVAVDVNDKDELALRVSLDLHRWLFDDYLIPKLLDMIRAGAKPVELGSVVGAVGDPLTLGENVLTALSAHGYAPARSHHETARADEQLRALALRVQESWITGVLDRAVSSDMMLSVDHRNIPEAIDRPWTTHIGYHLGEVTVEATRFRSPLDLFADSSRLLLILGDPGSGKTTTLLQLTRDLLHLYLTNVEAHVPVVLNLSTWRDQFAGIKEWAIRQLTARYSVPSRLAQTWLDGNRLTLILDGLDEIPDTHRLSCVDALNEFLAPGSTAGVVVACRLHEYRGLVTRLRLHGAAVLQPLTDAQIDEYLARSGPEGAELRDTLQHNEQLRRLTRTPLMLSVLRTALTESANPPSYKADDTAAFTAERLRDRIFASYVGSALRRSRLSSLEQTTMLRQLSLLARLMRRQGIAVFRVEDVQSSGFTNRSFLEAATSLDLLRRVGGDYVFMHRLLLEYFARRQPGVSEEPAL